MNNAQKIAARIQKGLVKAATKTGSGEYLATVIRKADELASDVDAGTPWGQAATVDPPVPETFTATVLDLGTEEKLNADMTTRWVRSLLFSAIGQAPKMGDKIELADGTYEILLVDATQTGGEAFLYEIEIAA